MSAYADGVSLLLGAHEELVDLDELTPDEALERAVALIADEYERVADAD